MGDNGFLTSILKTLLFYYDFPINTDCGVGTLLTFLEK